MKKIIVFIIALSYLTSSAQTPLPSKISEVKVYRQSAQITRKVKTSLVAGKQEIILTNISTHINPESLQVKISGSKNVALLSAKYERNYLYIQPKHPEVAKLKKQLDQLDTDARWIQQQQSIYNGMEDVLDLSKNLHASKSGFTPLQVLEMTNIYKNQLFEIRKELFELEKQQQKITKEKNQISAQLNELNAEFNKPSGHIVLQFSSLAPTTINLKCSYLVNQAGWNPFYDLKSKSINENVALNYKANVYQNTGQSWENVEMTISTGKPSTNKDRPTLKPLLVNYYIANYNRGENYGAGFNNKVTSQMAVSEDESSYKDGFQYNTQTSNNELSISFKMNHKQRVKADGKNHIIPLESYSLPTEYVYQSIPKLDPAAFLLAKVSNWEKYNLISGPANLFFDDAYVGKSFINGDVTSDTLILSMGRDESIKIERVQKLDYSALKFLGGNKKETLGFEISIKNNKPKPLNIEILDQIPVSQNKDIVVALLEKEGAQHNKESGTLLWKIRLAAGESKKVKFQYSVKSPKDQQISGLR